MRLLGKGITGEKITSWWVVRDDSSSGLALRVNAARCCLASLGSNLNAGSHPHDAVQYRLSELTGFTAIFERMVGRAGFEPATN